MDIVHPPTYPFIRSRIHVLPPTHSRLEFEPPTHCHFTDPIPCIFDHPLPTTHHPLSASSVERRVPVRIGYNFIVQPDVYSASAAVLVRVLLSFSPRCFRFLLFPT